MKTSMSRFQIHDDLTAPDGSVPVLRGALATGGQLPNFLGVLAGSPAALRAYARFRSELRHGKLTLATIERIALAVAEYYESEPGIAMHSRTARAAGLGIDEVAAPAQHRGHVHRRRVDGRRAGDGGGGPGGEGGHAATRARSSVPVTTADAVSPLRTAPSMVAGQPVSVQAPS